MELEPTVRELLALARRLSLDVRYARLDGKRGGLCRVHGRWLILVDGDSAAPEQLGTLAEALSELAIENDQLSPTIRRLLERASSRAAWREQQLTPKRAAGATIVPFPRTRAHGLRGHGPVRRRPVR